MLQRGCVPTTLKNLTTTKTATRRFRPGLKPTEADVIVGRPASGDVPSNKLFRKVLERSMPAFRFAISSRNRKNVHQVLDAIISTIRVNHGHFLTIDERETKRTQWKEVSHQEAAAFTMRCLKRIVMELKQQKKAAHAAKNKGKLPMRKVQTPASPQAPVSAATMTTIPTTLSRIAPMLPLNGLSPPSHPQPSVAAAQQQIQLLAAQQQQLQGQQQQVFEQQQQLRQTQLSAAIATKQQEVQQLLKQLNTTPTAPATTTTAPVPQPQPKPAVVPPRQRQPILATNAVPNPTTMRSIRILQVVPQKASLAEIDQLARALGDSIDTPLSARPAAETAPVPPPTPPVKRQNSLDLLYQVAMFMKN